MTSTIHNSLTPPERVAHLCQEAIHHFTTWGEDTLMEINFKDYEAIHNLLDEYDALKVKPTPPPSMWMSRDGHLAIILASVVQFSQENDGLKVWMMGGTASMIRDKRNQEAFCNAILAYRGYRDATDKS